MMICTSTNNGAIMVLQSKEYQTMAKTQEEKMATQRAAEMRWHKEHYEQIAIRLPKGYRNKLNAIASQKGVSMAALIKTYIDENWVE